VADDDGAMTEADEAVLRAAQTGDGLVMVGPEAMAALAKAARDTSDEFDAQMADMSRERAEFVRRLRCEQEYTWRAVAATCALEWAGDWGSNQLAGMAICRRAAALFGEDYMRDPWN
jgi:hypothetical protein